jgi:hypothetical protein
MGPRAILDIMEHRKISCPSWDLNPALPSLQLDHYTDFAVSAPLVAIERKIKKH